MATLSIMVGNEQGDVPVSILRLEGDIDASTYKSLEEKASELISDGTAKILLDLSGVKYMGSAGFRAIHAISNMLDKDGPSGLNKSPHLKLLNPTDDVSRVIKTLGFDVYLDIFKDREEAINSF